MEQTGESSSQETKKNDLNRKLVCIEYPGLVKNEDNMIKTLGGLNKLSEVMKTKTQPKFVCLFKLFFHLPNRHLIRTKEDWN